MKCNTVQWITGCVLTALLISSAPSVAVAGSLYWDATPGAANGASDGGAGTWDLSAANWDNTTVYQAWINSNNDTAVFGGTAGTVTLGAHVTIGGLDFAVTGYIITNGVGSYTITNGTPVTINVTAGTATIFSEIAGTNSITKTGAGTLVLRGLNSWTGDTIISGGVLQIGFGTSSSLEGGSYAGNISIAGSTKLLLWSTDNEELSGIISGAGGIETAYSGTTTLSGANTYTGKTSIKPNTTSGSTLSVTSFNSVNGGSPLLPSSSLGCPTTVADGTIDLGDGGKRASCTLIYTGTGETSDRIINISFNSSSSQTINSSGSGLLKFTSAFLSNAGGAHTGTLQLRGTGQGEIVQGLPALPTGGLVKLDNGTWTLGGTSVYTSPTLINGGTLIVNGTLASTNVTINSAGTLGGTGTVNGEASVAAGGTLAPGTNAFGTLTFEDDLTLNNLSTYAFDGEDLTVVSGTLTLNDNWTLVLGDEIKSGGSVVIFSYGALTGGADMVPTIDVSGLGFTPGTLSLTDTGSEIVLNGVQAASTPPAGTVLVIR